MSYSHLFVLDPNIRTRENKSGNLDYYRDCLTYILASDEHLSNEYALLRAIAINENFNFDEYAISIVDNRSIEETIPKTDDAKYDFLRHLAVLILECSDKCRTEDVIIFDAVAQKYGYTMGLLDEIVRKIVSRINSTHQHNIDLKNSIISSYKYAKEVDRKKFVETYLRESMMNEDFKTAMF